MAIDSVSLKNISKLENKIAKNYSSKFCNAIGIGISKDGAMKLSINENLDPKFNSSLWLELAFSGKENLKKINKEDLAEKISENVIRDCGAAIGLSGQNGEVKFKEYFVSIRDILENSKNSNN